jgi:O-antigen ligase
LKSLDHKAWSAVLLMFAVLLLYPFSRWSGAPVLLLSLAGAFVLVREWATLGRLSGFRVLLGLWLCFWLPLLISSLDAVNPGDSWRTSLAALRFPLVGAFLIYGLNNDTARRRLWQLTAGLTILWCFDALLQAMLGFNLLGMPLSADRPNGIFGATNIKLGPVLAVLSPLALEYARCHWPKALLPLTYLLFLAVIIVIGTRSAWVMYSVVTAFYLFLYARSQGRRWLKATALVFTLTALVGVTAYQLSPNLQQRVQRSLLMFQGDAAALDEALSNRLPIWNTALNMTANNPINGVGVRGFRDAYGDYANASDPWVDFPGDTGAHHAHQLLLEVATETGLIGLAGLLCALLLGWRHWRSLDVTQRAAARPYAIALAVMLFPINTHLAFYSTFWSLLLWWLIIAYCASSQESDSR